MVVPAPLPSPPQAARDHHFHPVRVARVVAETPDAASFVLDVPDDGSFAYRAGQFCTFRVRIEGETLLRCYSMSSTPGLDPELQVTVKRVPGGLVSNWLLDNVGADDVVEATLPAGVFCLDPAESGELVAFAGGSGITPVFSLVKEALATTDRRVRLLYANRDREHTIFAEPLDGLAAEHPDRFELVHHLDVERGFVDAAAVTPLVAGTVDPDVYLCGPTPFMDLVEDALVADGLPAERIRAERFGTPVPAPVPDQSPVDDGAAAVEEAPTEVTIELGGRTESTRHHPGTTILQTARELGLPAPSSCEAGSCATCMARVVEGSVSMRVNDALADDEVAEGWVLTCQSVPTSPSVRVVYEGS